MKIIAIVKFDDEWAYVFDKDSPIKYTEKNIDGARYLVGESPPLYDFLKYEKSPVLKKNKGVVDER